MKPTLVILAAGIGSRYGGLKQLEPIGPGGATIIDYSVYDALRAGFGKLVFVIRPDMEAAFRSSLGQRFEKHVPVACAFQRLDAVPDGFEVPPDRTKPWGTGHAVLIAGDAVDEPFGVVNADDFYGASSFVALSEFLQAGQDAGVPTYAMVGYALRDTLAESGTVARGVCRCTPDGWLRTIVEVTGIAKHAADGRHADQTGAVQTIRGDTPVSMNMWGFTPAIFDQLRSGFRAFLRERGESSRAEFYLPVVIQDAISGGHARVKVLPSRDVWCGITHPQDKRRAAEVIRGLIARGEYPQRLWG